MSSLQFKVLTSILLHRVDLKPNNIGFIGNTVQIFDFGLSRELPALDTAIPFAMSGKVGTLRYMAPEVARHKNYNVSADIYSFAMVSYELLSLEKPYDGWTRDMHAELVCGRGLRPDTTNTMHPVSPEMRLMLEQAWSSNPSSRGTMSHIGSNLQYLESQQVKYLSEQQRQIEFQQQQLHRQQQQPQLPMTLSVPLLPQTPRANSCCFVDMSFYMANPTPTKVARGVSLDDDSIGTIETSSLSADSDRYF